METLTPSEQKIERAVRVSFCISKDKVIAALDKKSLTVEEKLKVLEQLGINPTKKLELLYW